MKLKEIYELADSLAPFSLSGEFIARGYRDNSGVMFDLGGEITGVLFSLDLSLSAVEEAKRLGCNLIFTHHPAIWDGVMRFTREEHPALWSCVREGISVISAHLNLDAAAGGIDESLMRGLGGRHALAVFEQLSAGGYGRVYDVPPCTLGEFISGAKETFSTDRVVAYGDRPVGRVASFCGAGLGEKELLFAAENGADTVVSSDGKHHLILSAEEKGLNLVLLTHYAAEHYGLCRFAENMKKNLGERFCHVFADSRFL